VDDDSLLLGYDTAALSKWLPTPSRYVVPPSPRICISPSSGAVILLGSLDPSK